MIRSNTTKKAVLGFLLNQPGTVVSGADLCRIAGVSRQSVWKAVESLREEGFEIEAIPHKGYRLLETSAADLSPTWLELALQDTHWGKPVLFWKSLASTQEPAKELARQGAPEGLLVLAGEQTSGRGRLGRKWQSPREGSICFSVIIRPDLLPGRIQLLSFAAAVAVHETLEKKCGTSFELKWPNDILYRGAKVCGILTETASEPGHVHFAVTGIGLNANMDSGALAMDVANKSTSLLSILGRPVHRGEIIESIVRIMEREVRLLEEPSGNKRCIAEYAKRCSTVGREVIIRYEDKIFSGTAIGISDSGEIILETSGAEKTFAAADITHLRTH
jgi:BirA family biotin operon repressor/biotin-[acetyl-CoA-carboxylase] ligase